MTVSINNEVEKMKEELVKLCEKHKLCQNNLSDVVNKASEHFLLLLKWNKKISLTKITDPKLAAKQLYFESLFPTRFIDKETKSLTDIGTGAGFPGIPIALALPEIETTLIESDQRKFAFLGEVRRTVKIPNLVIINQPFQKVLSSSNIVTIRALEKFQTQIPNILKFAARSKQIILFISLPTAETILETYKQELLSYKTEITLLPESENRVLLQLYNLNYSICST